MLAKLKTFTLLGIDAYPVDVEIDVSTATSPHTILVGLPDAAVRESRHRVDRALANSGFFSYFERVVINLAPAELPKQAASFDLPISLGLLLASDQVHSDRIGQYAVVGELSLSGHTRPVRGLLSMALAARRDPALRGLVVPAANAGEAAVVEEIDVIPVGSLTETVAFFSGELEIPPLPSRRDELFAQADQYDVDYRDVRGQEMAKRALTIAAAGGHNLLMLGPPGSGKTMLAKRMPTILPPLTAEESIETSRIYSAMGRLDPKQPLLVRRPYRAPHHTISDAGLVGGGSIPVPGEISLSHHGVLFLDELLEYNRRTLEVLRQPLEDGVVTISRAMKSSTFPADFMLVAALNPCPCGYRNDPRRQCQCSEFQIERYMSRISGPLLDRIDIHIEVPAVPFSELATSREGTDSQSMREQVVEARNRQLARRRTGRPFLNNRLPARQLRQECRLSSECLTLLQQSVSDMGLSARAHDKVLRVARTIADLEGRPDIRPEDLMEAVNYRLLDRANDRQPSLEDTRRCH